MTTTLKRKAMLLLLAVAIIGLLATSWMWQANQIQTEAGYSYYGNGSESGAEATNPHVPHVEGSKVFSSAGDASTMSPSSLGDTTKICDHSTNGSEARGVGIMSNGNRIVVRDDDGNGGGCGFAGVGKNARAHYGCTGLNAGCGPVSRH